MRAGAGGGARAVRCAGGGAWRGMACVDARGRHEHMSRSGVGFVTFGGEGAGWIVWAVYHAI